MRKGTRISRFLLIVLCSMCGLFSPAAAQNGEGSTEQPTDTTNLYLSDSGLIELPTEIFQLTNLTELNLHSNPFDVPYATNLNNPRHISFDADGTLYIAEAGSAGQERIPNPSGDGEVLAGETAQVTVVSPTGESTVLIPDLTSIDLGDMQIVGVHAVHVFQDRIYLVYGQGRTPGGPAYLENLPMNGIGIGNREGFSVVHYIDLFSYEEQQNPDASEEIASNPMDFAFVQNGEEVSTIYIADASANAVLRWDVSDGNLSTFAAWPPDKLGVTPPAVPTSVEVDSAGNVYVGFLSGYPFTPGTARVEVYDSSGELLTTYPGLTYVTDILLTQDGSLYAVEMASSYSDEAETGFTPASGRVVQITSDRLIPIATDLNFPFGMAQAPDGTLYVTLNSEFSEPDSGIVVRVDP